MRQYAHITSRCFVNVPYPRLVQDFDLIRTHRLQPEIGLEGEWLYTTPRVEFAAVAAQLHAEDLACTIHAPFFDLLPGALDRQIRAASRDKLRRAFELLPLFQPRSIVCHLGFEANKHGYKEAEWFGHARDTFQELLAMAEASGVTLMLENTYETSPTQLKDMLTALDSPHARFCFDLGHSLAFAKNSWRDWFPTMAPWLGQLHIHDNDGSRDAHLAPGQGVFDFAGFFAYLHQAGLDPIITLEPHTEAALWESLAALDRMACFRLAERVMASP